MVQLREAALHPNWSLTPAGNGGTEEEAGFMCSCCLEQMEREKEPIRNSIKFTSGTGAVMGGKKMDMII